MNLIAALSISMLALPPSAFAQNTNPTGQSKNEAGAGKRTADPRATLRAPGGNENAAGPDGLPLPFRATTHPAESGTERVASPSIIPRGVGGNAPYSHAAT